MLCPGPGETEREPRGVQGKAELPPEDREPGSQRHPETPGRRLRITATAAEGGSAAATLGRAAAGTGAWATQGVPGAVELGAEQRG